MIAHLEKPHFWRKMSLLVFAIATSLFLFTKCMPVDYDIANPQLTFSDNGRIAFEKDAASKTIEVTCNRDWKVVKGKNTDWIIVGPKAGKEGTTTLTIDVKSNDGEAREGFLSVTASTLEKTIIITQKAKYISEIEHITINEIPQFLLI